MLIVGEVCATILGQSGVEIWNLGKFLSEFPRRNPFMGSPVLQGEHLPRCGRSAGQHMLFRAFRAFGVVSGHPIEFLLMCFDVV